jgi:hypothetical protein
MGRAAIPKKVCGNKNKKCNKRKGNVKGLRRKKSR